MTEPDIAALLQRAQWMLQRLTGDRPHGRSRDAIAKAEAGRLIKEITPALQAAGRLP